MAETEERPLTGKQKAFADYYVGEASLNATRAAKLAGYSGDENTLAAIGSQNLRKIKVRAYIDEKLDALTLTASEILTILTKQAKGSLADVLDEDGNFDLADAKKRGVDGLLKKLKVKEFRDKETGDVERTYEYEIHDAKDAAVHLGRYRKLFADRVEHTGKDGGAIETRYVVEVLSNDGEAKHNENQDQ